jgi:vacuolar-type H+-ATPase subunit I/STV1
MKQIQEVVERVKVPTPTHFKRIIVFGLALVILGFIILLIAAIWPTPTLLAIEQKMFWPLVNIGTAMAGVSITARKDKNQI